MDGNGDGDSDDDADITAADAADAADFMISSDGVLSFEVSPDYETRDANTMENTYKVGGSGNPTTLPDAWTEDTGAAIMMGYK